MPLVGGNYPTWGVLWRSIVTDVCSLTGSGTIQQWGMTITGPTPFKSGGTSIYVKQGDVVQTAVYALTSWIPNNGPGSIGEIVRSPGFSDAISHAFGIEDPSAPVLVPMLASMRKQILGKALYVDPKNIAEGYLPLINPVNAIANAVWNYITTFTSGPDSGTDVMVVQDTTQLPSTQIPQPPAGPSYHPQVINTQVPVIQVAIFNTQDVALNRNQVVYTAQSRTNTNTPTGIK